MRIIFAGTPEFAVPSFNRLIEKRFQVAAVYTQSDRPAGRGRGVRVGPVKLAAQRASVPIYQPASLKSEEEARQMESLRPDIVVVVAYGLILPDRILDLPPLGCLNVHASLLPRWRGAAPIARALEAGDHFTGVSLMKMDAGLDTGPVYATRKAPIEPEDDAGTIHDKLAVMGAELLTDSLPQIASNEMVAQPQSEQGVNYAAKLSKAEAEIDWSRPAQVVANKVRAFCPWPVASARYGEHRIRVLQARALDGAVHSLTPGSVVAAGKDGIDVACGQGTIRLLRLQREGGKPLRADQFLNGFELDAHGSFR